MTKNIKIDNKFIGEGRPVFIIAEAGVNHNGSLKIAKKMVEAAAEVGADAVKFQTFKAEGLTTKSAEKAEYQKVGSSENFQYDMLKRLELTKAEFKELFLHCKKKKIIFLSTPYDEASADFLEDLGIGAFKISSSDITNIPFLIHIAKKNTPVIISTGASYLEEVKKAVVAVKKQYNKKIILLHCTASYPTQFSDVNLRAMLTLKKEFSSLLVGYSDHTLSMTVPIMAVALGANVLEKHFTLDKKLHGPDHKASLEPNEFKDMVQSVRDAETALGSFIKKPTGAEEEDRRLGRRSIVAKRDMSVGVVIDRDDLIMKRPGSGISPTEINMVIGRVAKVNISKDTTIKWKMIK